MKTKQKFFKTFLIGFLIAALTGLLFANAAFAEDDSLREVKDKFRKGTILLRKIDSSLQSEQKNLGAVRENVKAIKVRIQKTKEKIQTLKGQLQNLQSLLSQSSKKFLALRKQIAEKRTELEILKEMVEKKKTEKRLLEAKYFAQAHTLKNSFIQEDNEFGALSILLAFEGLADFFQNQSLLDVENKQSERFLKDIERASLELGLTQKKLVQKYETLQELKEKQKAELRNLRYHQEAKKRLLSSTKGQEEIYKVLLEQAKQEQDDVLKNIERLKENFEFVDQKLAALREDEFLQDAISLEDFEQDLQNIPLQTNADLRWPVPPIRGISAYFRDEAYRKAMGIPHSAIDIRVLQETSVRAAKVGVVLKVRDSDEGYNYLILAHRDGLLTLYGHLTEILVKEGDTVFTGEIIAKSGGIPGTRGAGWLTTGAHLHFEVFENWKHVDPLDYLALEFLPIEYVPEKYLSRLVGEEEKVKRVQEKKVRREADIVE